IQHQPTQSQAQRLSAFKDELFVVEDTLIVPTRARASSLDNKDGVQKSHTNALISDFVMIESYYNGDQENQGKMLTKTDWMRILAKGGVEDIPTETLQFSLAHGIPSELRPSIWTVLAKVK